MENYTYNSFFLQIEGLRVSEDNMYPILLIILLFYIFIMVANVSIFLLVCLAKNLHQPMYVLFCNLTINEILANSNVLPVLMKFILLPPSQRLMTYYECVAQAFTFQFSATVAHSVLMVMAVDRYIAISNPLRYSTIMNNRMVVKLTASAWGIPFVLVSVLLGLTIRLSRCRTLIANPFCDNASLFKLSCESVVINNVYGLTFTVVLLTSSLGCIVLTYTKIATVCLTSKSKSINSKALKTCSTHLSLYLIMFFTGMVPIFLHRFPQYDYERKVSVILFLIIPGSLNPIIYGVQSSEIRKLMSTLLSKQHWYLTFCFKCRC